MTSVAVFRAPSGCVPSTHHADSLAHVELTHIEKRIENWIGFGRHVGERIVDRRRRVLSFRPGSVFAFVRWAANDYGTVASRIDIVRAVEPGETYQTLPFVRPGGEILLHVEAWPKVERVSIPIGIGQREGIGVLGLDRETRTGRYCIIRPPSTAYWLPVT